MTKHNIEWLEGIRQDLWSDFFDQQVIMQDLCREIIPADYYIASSNFLCFKDGLGNEHWFSKDVVTCLVDPDKNAYYYAPSWLLRKKGL